MATKLNRLTARQVAAIKKPGRHADGGNLYLKVEASGAKRFVFFYRFQGRQREAGLGSASSISLAKARELAAEMREQLAGGIDPIEARRHGQAARAGRMTFGEAAERLIAARESSWRSSIHRRQWVRTLGTHAASLADLPADTVSTAHVIAVLEPVWRAVPETAQRLRGRIEMVLDFARVHGAMSADTPNPARWKGHLEHLLPKRQKLTRGHHAAMPYRDLPEFMSRLQDDPSISQMALAFAILTAARTGEVLGSRWSEIDLASATWTVPANRMKAGREHVTPLSEPALAILATLASICESDFVFPGQRRGKPLSAMALALVLRSMGVKTTTHGFRSSFRDWAGDQTDFPREIAEAALAHVVGSDVERSYRRSAALEKRRELMRHWAEFIAPASRDPQNGRFIAPSDALDVGQDTERS